MNAAFLTLKEVLHLSVPAPITWLRGDDDGSRQVHWAATQLEDAGPDDLLLLPAARYSSELLTQAEARSVLAVLFVGENPALSAIPKGDVIILSTPETAGEMRDIQRLILTALINQRAVLVERGVRIHAQLSQLEAEGEGLPGLAKAMQEISGKGVLIQDKRGQILVQHPSSTLLTIWGDVLDQMSTPDSLPEPLSDRKNTASQAAIHRQVVPGGLERQIRPIVVGEIARGYLSLVGLEGDFDELDHLVLEQGGIVSAIEMARNKAIREAEKRLKGDLLTALLQGDLSARDAALWVQQMGLDLTQAFTALRFVWDGPASLSRRRLETLVNGEVARLGLAVIASPMGSEYVCFCQVPPGSKRPEPALALGKAVLEQGIREYPQTHCRCGVGSSVLSLEGWRISLREAGQALDLARRLESSTPLYFPDLSVYRLLFQLEHNPEIISFQEETLGRLLEHDTTGELIRTLDAYFEHNGNLSQAAVALYVHRNTLIYRIERIEALTRLDLDNPEERLALQLALRIYRMQGSKD